jgi:hypothetical protein
VAHRFRRSALRLLVDARCALALRRGPASAA